MLTEYVKEKRSVLVDVRGRVFVLRCVCEKLGVRVTVLDRNAVASLRENESVVSTDSVSVCVGVALLDIDNVTSSVFDCEGLSTIVDVMRTSNVLLPLTCWLKVNVGVCCSCEKDAEAVRWSLLWLLVLVFSLVRVTVAECDALGEAVSSIEPCDGDVEIVGVISDVDDCVADLLSPS